MTKKISKFLVPIIIFTAFSIPFFVQGQTGTGGNSDVSGEGGDSQTMTIFIRNPFRQDTIQGLITTIIDNILIPIGGVIAVLMIIYAGFLFVTAGGDTTKIAKARNALLWAVIGAAILLGARVISQAIETTIDQLERR